MFHNHLITPLHWTCHINNAIIRQLFTWLCNVVECVHLLFLFIYFKTYHLCHVIIIMQFKSSCSYKPKIIKYSVLCMIFAVFANTQDTKLTLIKKCFAPTYVKKLICHDYQEAITSTISQARNVLNCCIHLFFIPGQNCIVSLAVFYSVYWKWIPLAQLYLWMVFWMHFWLLWLFNVTVCFQ